MSTRPVKITNLLIQTFWFTVASLLLFFAGRAVLGSAIHFINQFNPVENKITDFALSDLCFKVTHKREAYPDTNVVIINCADKNKAQIADIISKLFALKQVPKAIGIDILFDEKDTLNNFYLASTISKYADDIVLVASDASNFGDKELSKPFYQCLLGLSAGKNIVTGSISGLHKNSIVRTFIPFPNDTSVDNYSFAVAVIEAAYPRSYLHSLFKRNEEQKEEIINYRRLHSGNSRFLVLDPTAEEISLAGNKIVLLGGLQSGLQDDRWFTPLNAQMGLAAPDMFGVEMHAHIIATIINRDYIDPINYKKVLALCLIYFLFTIVIVFLSEKKLYHVYLHVLLIVFCLLFIGLCSTWLENDKQLFEPAVYIFPFYVGALFIHPVKLLLEKTPYVKKYFPEEHMEKK